MKTRFDQKGMAQQIADRKVSQLFFVLLNSPTLRTTGSLAFSAEPANTPINH